MKTKLSKHSFHEELLSLSASNKAWSDITVNFVTDFSKFNSYKNANVFDCVMMTINRLTKMTHYSSCAKTMNLKQFAFLLIKDVISHHDLFERIISDKKSLFISHFWIVLSKKLKANHKLSSTFHSQTNDQIERQSQTLKQYLRSVMNFLQNDWIDHFFLAKYIYNDFHHSIIQISLFRANTKKHSISFVLHFYHEKRFSTSVEETTKKIIKLQK